MYVDRKKAKKSYLALLSVFLEICFTVSVIVIDVAVLCRLQIDAMTIIYNVILYQRRRKADHRKKFYLHAPVTQTKMT